jgi:hypothetical protein
MLLDSGGYVLWYTIKETVNFLSSTKTGTSGSERDGYGDVRGTIKGDWYHRVWYAWYSEFKIMIPSDKGIIECRSVHRDVCEGVFREV